MKNHNKKAVQKDPSDLFHETFLHLMVVFKFSIFFLEKLSRFVDKIDDFVHTSDRIWIFKIFLLENYSSCCNRYFEND